MTKTDTVDDILTKGKKMPVQKSLCFDETVLVMGERESEKLIDEAVKLGIKKLMLLHSMNNKERIERDDINLDVKTYTKDMKKNRHGTVMFVENAEKIRGAADHFKDSYIILPLYSLRKKHFNHIVAKILRDNNDTIVIDFTEILRARNRKGIMSNLAYIVRIMKRYRVKINLSPISEDPWDMRNPADMKSFLEVILKTKA